MTKVTIGLPVYNGEREIEATLDALLAQTYDDFILLVSDNASTDATTAILRRYADRDRRIRLVVQPENIGASANFLYLITAAQTPFFGWCGADDIPLPSYIERCMRNLIEAPSALLCCTDVILTLANGERWKYYENFETIGCDVESRLHRLVRLFGWYQTYGICRREEMLAFGKPSTRFGSDVSFSAKWLCEWDLACVHEPLYLSRFVHKSPAAFAIQTGDTGPVAQQPWSQLLGDIGAAVRAQIEPNAVLSRRLLASMARTIAFENMTFCNAVLAEQRLDRNDLDVRERFKLIAGLFAGTHG